MAKLERMAQLSHRPGGINTALRIAGLSACLALAPAGFTDTRDQGHQIMFKSLLSKIGFSGGAAAAQDQPPETIGQLRDAVVERLRREPEVQEITGDVADPAVLRVKLLDAGGETVDGTANVTNVYGRLYTLKNDLDRAAAIENMAQSILVTVRRPEIDMARVFANIRFRAPEGSDAPDSATLSEPLAGDIRIVYQLDTPESLMGLSQADLGAHSMEELRAAARQNITREMASLQEERVNGGIVAYRLPDNPPLTPAIVLTEEFWARVARDFPDGALLILRQRDEVAVIDRKAPGAMGTAQRLIGMARERGTDFLSDLVFERRDGKLEVAE